MLAGRYRQHQRHAVGKYAGIPSAMHGAAARSVFAALEKKAIATGKICNNRCSVQVHQRKKTSQAPTILLEGRHIVFPIKVAQLIASQLLCSSSRHHFSRGRLVTSLLFSSTLELIRD